MRKLTLLPTLLLLSLFSFSQTAVFSGNTVLSGNTVIPAPQAVPPPVTPVLFTLEEHNISDPAAYPTIPFGAYREYGTSCQWNNMWTGVGDNYSFTCFGQQIAYADTFKIPLMFTFGQVPSGLSTINPDNAVGAPAQFPVAVNGVNINCTGGACTATVTTLQRLNAAVGDSLTLTGAAGCPENPNGTFVATVANNPTDYPGWTYSFNIGAGTISNSACGGNAMFLADNNQTATRCGGTGTAVGGQNGGCYSPNDVAVDGTGTDTHLISFLTQLLAYDAANDPNHRLTWIEVWNEPQGPGFFNGSIAQMARFTRDMYTVIQASAQASYLQLASPAPSGGLTSPASYLGLFGADPTNPFQYVSSIDNHTYNYPPGAGTPDPMSAMTIAANITAAISPFPSAAGKPRLATEGSWGFGPFGASTTNLGPNTGTAGGGDKAGWVVDAYMAHQCAGYSMYSFFAWDQQCNTGLACATPPPPYSISPAGISYGIAHDWLAGANIAQTCSKDGSNNWTLKLQRGSYNATALWNTGLTTVGSYTILPGIYSQYRDISGNVFPISPSQTAVPVQFDPILLETGNPPFYITTATSLPTATQGVPYSVTLQATGAGQSPYVWSEANLPSVITSLGLALNTSNGTISGTPTTNGTFNFQVRVKDVNQLTYALNFTLVINASTGGSADNLYTPWVSGACSPAYTGTEPYSISFPTRCQNSQRVNRPSPGATIVVGAGSSLQTALNAATCGQIIQLTAGATYGHVTFPALNCTVTNWLTITTTASASLPPEGTRITPCYTNIASLPGRPAYSCPTPAADLGIVQATGSGTLFDMSTNGSSFIQFIGVNFKNACTAPCTAGPLVQLGANTHDIVFDQVVMNGEEVGTLPQTSTTFTETTRGIGLGQSKNIMVVDSYFYDFYCVANTTGASGCDSQAISGGTGTTAGTLWGNYKFVNNYLEAAAETFEFGGGNGPPCSPTCADDSPADLEVRLNHMYKPLQWLAPPGTASGNGYPLVKNLFECKNCERAFLEGNIMENVWPGFTQNGTAILLTPKSQSGGCPNCSVHDVIIRYNLLHHGLDFVQLANSTSDSGALAFQGYGYSIHDNIMDNVGDGALCWGGSGQCTGAPMNQISTVVTLSVSSLILHNVSMNHNTTVEVAAPLANPASLIGLSGNTIASGFASSNITFSNSLGTQGSSGTINVTGSSSSCAHGVTAGINAINACWSPNIFTGNAIVSNTAIWGSSQCLLESSYSSIFVNYNNGVNGDYHVKPTSPCHNFDDGGTTDPGADVDMVTSKTSGVN